MPGSQPLMYVKIIETVSDAFKAFMNQFMKIGSIKDSELREQSYTDFFKGKKINLSDFSFIYKNFVAQNQKHYDYFSGHVAMEAFLSTHTNYTFTKEYMAYIREVASKTGQIEVLDTILKFVLPNVSGIESKRPEIQNDIIKIFIDLLPGNASLALTLFAYPDDNGHKQYNLLYKKTKYLLNMFDVYSDNMMTLYCENISSKAINRDFYIAKLNELILFLEKAHTFYLGQGMKSHAQKIKDVAIILHDKLNVVIQDEEDHATRQQLGGFVKALKGYIDQFEHRNTELKPSKWINIYNRLNDFYVNTWRARVKQNDSVSVEEIENNLMSQSHELLDEYKRLDSQDTDYYKRHYALMEKLIALLSLYHSVPSAHKTATLLETMDGLFYKIVKLCNKQKFMPRDYAALITQGLLEDIQMDIDKDKNRYKLALSDLQRSILNCHPHVQEMLTDVKGEKKKAADKKLASLLAMESIWDLEYKNNRREQWVQQTPFLMLNEIFDEVVKDSVAILSEYAKHHSAYDKELAAWILAPASTTEESVKLSQVFGTQKEQLKKYCVSVMRVINLCHFVLKEILPHYQECTQPEDFIRFKRKLITFLFRILATIGSGFHDVYFSKLLDLTICYELNKHYSTNMLIALEYGNDYLDYLASDATTSKECDQAIIETGLYVIFLEKALVFCESHNDNSLDTLQAQKEKALGILEEKHISASSSLQKLMRKFIDKYRQNNVETTYEVFGYTYQVADSALSVFRECEAKLKEPIDFSAPNKVFVTKFDEVQNNFATQRFTEESLNRFKYNILYLIELLPTSTRSEYTANLRKLMSLLLKVSKEIQSSKPDEDNKKIYYGAFRELIALLSNLIKAQVREISPTSDEALISTSNKVEVAFAKQDGQSMTDATLPSTDEALSVAIVSAEDIVREQEAQLKLSLAAQIEANGQALQIAKDENTKQQEAMLASLSQSFEAHSVKAQQQFESDMQTTQHEHDEKIKKIKENAQSKLDALEKEHAIKDDSLRQSFKAQEEQVLAQANEQIKAYRVKHENVVKELKAAQKAKIKEINEESKLEIQRLTDSLTSIQTQNKKTLGKLQKGLGRKLKKAKSENDEAIQALKTKHIQEKEALQLSHQNAVHLLKTQHESTMQSLTDEHQASLSSLQKEFDEKKSALTLENIEQEQTLVAKQKQTLQSQKADNQKQIATLQAQLELEQQNQESMLAASGLIALPSDIKIKLVALHSAHIPFYLVGDLVFNLLMGYDLTDSQVQVMVNARPEDLPIGFIDCCEIKDQNCYVCSDLTFICKPWRSIKQEIASHCVGIERLFCDFNGNVYDLFNIVNNADDGVLDLDLDFKKQAQAQPILLFKIINYIGRYQFKIASHQQNQLMLCMPAINKLLFSAYSSQIFNLLVNVSGASNLEVLINHGLLNGLIPSVPEDYDVKLKQHHPHLVQFWFNHLVFFYHHAYAINVYDILTLLLLLPVLEKKRLNKSLALEDCVDLVIDQFSHSFSQFSEQDLVGIKAAVKFKMLGTKQCQGLFDSYVYYIEAVQAVEPDTKSRPILFQFKKAEQEKRNENSQNANYQKREKRQRRALSQ